MKRMLASFALVGALLLPAAAEAATTAYATRVINMRAGPGTDYPIVARVGRDSRVVVYGCLRGYSWCDASVRGVRGWVNSSRLEFAYQGRRVLVPGNYRSFGAPIISFNFGYWDRYYSDRPFFRERGKWDHNWRDSDRRRGDDRDNDRDRNDRQSASRDGDGRDGDGRKRDRDGDRADRRDGDNSNNDGFDRRRGGGDGQICMQNGQRVDCPRL